MCSKIKLDEYRPEVCQKYYQNTFRPEVCPEIGKIKNVGFLDLNQKLFFSDLRRFIWFILTLNTFLKYYM